jgi:hypothetical protein
MEQYKINLLKLAAKYDIKDTFLWNEELEFSIICSDSFFFATADAEDVLSQEDVDLLEQCIKDCLDTGDRLGELHGTLLYVAKKRKMRPLLDIYTHIPKAVQELLNACGPEKRNLFNELKEGIESLKNF